MGRIKSNILRSLNGRLGYLDKESDGTWSFYPKEYYHNKKVKPIWKNLQKWEIKMAIKHTVKVRR
jgi:hypothetical protein